MALRVDYQHDGFTGTFSARVAISTWVYLAPLVALGLAAVVALGSMHGAQALAIVGFALVSVAAGLAGMHGPFGARNQQLTEELLSVTPHRTQTRRLEARGHWLEVDTGKCLQRVYLPGCRVRVQGNTVWVHAALTDEAVAIVGGPADGAAVERLARALRAAARVAVGHAADVPRELRALRAQGALDPSQSTR